MTPTQEAERSRLSKKTVVDRGLALADADGLDRLTIRRLAQDLGVTPMALYWHFHSKEELLLGLADQIWSEIDVDLDQTQPWSHQLKALLESLVRALRVHPSAGQLLLETEKQSEPFLRATEVTLELLRSAGFDALYATEIARSAMWTGLMLVNSEPGAKPGLPPDELAEHFRRNRVRMAMLPPATYPRVVECSALLTGSDDPEFHYKFGVDLFIAGIEAMAARVNPSS
jgi:AcrR family transcriptional regulator